jgi:hypothetical protein
MKVMLTADNNSNSCTEYACIIKEHQKGSGVRLAMYPLGGVHDQELTLDG